MLLPLPILPPNRTFKFLLIVDIDSANISRGSSLQMSIPCYTQTTHHDCDDGANVLPTQMFVWQIIWQIIWQQRKADNLGNYLANPYLSYSGLYKGAFLPQKSSRFYHTNIVSFRTHELLANLKILFFPTFCKILKHSLHTCAPQPE